MSVGLAIICCAVHLELIMGARREVGGRLPRWEGGWGGHAAEGLESACAGVEAAFGAEAGAGGSGSWHG